MIAHHLINVYYLTGLVASATGSVLLWLAASRGQLQLRPWFAAAIPAAAGYFVVNLARLIVDDDDWLTDISRGITLYGLFVLYNVLPYAAWHHANLTPVALDVFVAEVERQLVDTGEIPITLKDDGGDGVA